MFNDGITMGMIRETLWTYTRVNPLIGLRGLKGINSKIGVSTIESVVFHNGIDIGVDRGAKWT